MTPAEHTAQRDLVTASLAATHHPDLYARRTRVVPGSNAQPMAGALVESNPRVYAPRGEEAGCDGCPSAPTPAIRDCPRCAGEGEVHAIGQSLHPSAGVYVDDPQTETTIPCRACAGTGVVPVAVRRIPNTRRGM